MSKEMIQVHKEVHDDAMEKFFMAFELIELAVESFEGTDDTPTQTLVKCACEKLGEAGQSFTDMDPENHPDRVIEAA